MTRARNILFALAGAVSLTACSSMDGPMYTGSASSFAPASMMSSSRTVAPQYQQQIVANPTGEDAGTIVIETSERFLYYVQEDGTAIRYGIGVGREGFGWSGVARVGRKAEWPTWTPPSRMRDRQPGLPVSMAGGPMNPLGARALYLYQGGRDTLYRIHGTNEPWSIGQNVSSGCIRMMNNAVIDLFERVPTGTRVVVR